MSAADSAEPAEKPAEPSSVRSIKQLDRLIGSAEEVLLVLFVAALTVVASTQVITNAVWNFTYDWSNEVLRYMVFFTAMTGAALAAQTKKLINMDVVTRKLSPRVRAYVRIITTIFTIAVCLMLVKGGLELRSSMADEGDYELIKPSLGVLALPVGAGLMALHLALHLAIDAIYLARGSVQPEDTTPSLH